MVIFDLTSEFLHCYKVVKLIGIKINILTSLEDFKIVEG